MSKTFVLGDLHNGYKALLQVLKLSNFDKEIDTLISIGDTVDGWPDAVECVEKLLTIKNFIGIKGNHDAWCQDYLEYGDSPNIWLTQGGYATYSSYQKHPKFKVKHIDFFKKLHYYYIDEADRAFVHGGYTSMEGLGHDRQQTYMWDRSLWARALSVKKGHLNMTKMYNKLFIGHTSLGTNSLPKKASNVWNIDVGGGFEGKLCLMNVETEEYFMSDRVKDLYPEVKGR